MFCLHHSALVGVRTVAALALLSGCAYYHPVVSKESLGIAALGRLLEADSIGVAFETLPACKLQKADATADPRDDGWSAVDSHTLVGKRFTVRDRRVAGQVGGGGDSYSLALLLEDAQHDRMWLRNVPTPDAKAAVTELRCLVDTRLAEQKKPKLVAKVVRLDTETGACPAVTPIIGTRDDVSLAPYTVTGYGFFAGRPPSDKEALEGKQGVIAVGVTLEAEGGEKRLTVPTAVLDRCFAAADRLPPPPGEARNLLEWLTGQDPDSKAPPAVSLETVEAVTGVSHERCKKDGSGSTIHYECRAPVLRITPTYDAGPFGPKVLQLTRERLVDAMHVYAGWLVPSTEVVEVTAAVRTPKLAAGSAFARTFQATLGASIEDAQARFRRGSHGFRLMRASGGGRGAQPTHYVDIDMTYSVPDIETSTESRTHKYIAGKKKVPNPAYDKAVEEVESSKAAVESAKQSAEVAKQAAETAKQGCAQLSGFAALACNAGTSAVGAGVGIAAVTSAQERLGRATAALASTPKELIVDDERTWEYQAKLLRRKGDAVAQLSIAPAGGAGTVQFAATIKIPFEAVDVEIPDDPEHKLQGKKAAPPSVEAVEKTLAEALLPKIDDAIIKWGAQRQVGGDLGDMLPGTRSWMVGVARRAANDRPVKLVSDLLENRPDVLETPLLVYPVKMPADSAERCFTFAAIPLDGKADVNLQFGVPPPPGSKRFLAMGKDSRPDPDAAFEICYAPPGTYAVGITFGKGGSSKAGVLVSMFDSTPGKATNKDTLAAAKGLPTVSRKGEALLLNGEGVVEFTGAGKTKVTGRTGDRDGDGIPDDMDRCPYDPETFNGYLDEDGCPDEPPPGFKPPEGWHPPGYVAPPPPVAAAPPTAVVEPPPAEPAPVPAKAAPAAKKKPPVVPAKAAVPNKPKAPSVFVP